MARILLVDDEPEIVFLAKIILEKGGHEVVVACSGEECQEKLMDNKPDLIMLDVMMPGQDGWEVCKEIKECEETRKIPVVMVTALNDEESMKKSLNYAHADAHIKKPFDMKEMLDTVERLSGKAAFS